MVLVSGQRLGISRWNRTVRPQDEHNKSKQGLVLSVDVTFAEWLSGERISADVFVDPGADTTIISLRWLQAQGRRLPKIDEWKRLSEPMHIHFSGACSQAAGAEHEPFLLRQCPIYPQSGGGIQPPQSWKGRPQMPGLEDIILGRDFLGRHGIMLLLDGDHSFSLLWPGDPDNQRHRQEALALFCPQQTCLRPSRR